MCLLQAGGGGSPERSGSTLHCEAVAGPPIGLWDQPAAVAGGTPPDRTGDAAERPSAHESPGALGALGRRLAEAITRQLVCEDILAVRGQVPRWRQPRSAGGERVAATTETASSTPQSRIRIEMLGEVQLRASRGSEDGPSSRSARGGPSCSMQQRLGATAVGPVWLSLPTDGQMRGRSSLVITTRTWRAPRPPGCPL